MDIVIKELKEQLAAAQAREKVLRSALETLACLGNGCHHGNSTGNLIAIEALAQPTDDTALNNLLAEGQAREKVLRDALKMQPRNLRTVWKDGIDLDLPDRITEIRDEALAMPVNDTALRGLLEHENSVWYSALGPNYVDFNPVGAVRAFEAQVKLEAMCEMERYHDTTLKAALANERERYKKAFQKMRNVAAGYSNHCEDNGSTRRLEREFAEAEKIFSTLGD